MVTLITPQCHHFHGSLIPIIVKCFICEHTNLWLLREYQCLELQSYNNCMRTNEEIGWRNEFLGGRVSSCTLQLLLVHFIYEYINLPTWVVHICNLWASFGKYISINIANVNFTCLASLLTLYNHILGRLYCQYAGVLRSRITMVNQPLSTVISRSIGAWNICTARKSWNEAIESCKTNYWRYIVYIRHTESYMLSLL